MSIWGKVLGGVAGFALGGPLGALLGAVAGHALDKVHGTLPHGRASLEDQRQIAFTLAVIALSAKMAKADGQVTRDEVDAFKRLFHIPPDEMKNVAKVFDRAKVSTAGFEQYAAQVAKLFPHEPAVLEELLGGLFMIAQADGVVHPAELAYLQRVSDIFGFDQATFERITATHQPKDEADPYSVLGLAREATDAEIKSAYRKLIQETHPDKLMAQGMPQEFIDLANDKMAAINAAYDKIKQMRGLN
ncbi:TerB family tellurite resistance protein [Magnetovibrio sp. PR-2]|uniref:TerB family tellurite resistance protein n=1 Tax=Magnetovibrio sp. PR-2 TaxID=3120356 RepID=UPI002FCE2B44